MSGGIQCIVSYGGDSVCAVSAVWSGVDFPRRFVGWCVVSFIAIK